MIKKIGLVKNNIIENVIVVDDSDMSILDFLEFDFFIDDSDYDGGISIGMELLEDRTIKPITESDRPITETPK